MDEFGIMDFAIRFICHVDLFVPDRMICSQYLFGLDSIFHTGEQILYNISFSSFAIVKSGLTSNGGGI